MMKKNISTKAAIIKLSLLIPLLAITISFFMLEAKTVMAESGANPLETFESLFWQNPDKPDIPPIDPGQFDFGLYVGKTGGKTAQFTSVYDTTWGVELVTLPEATVRSTASGIVTQIEENHPWYGNYIKIKHNDVYETMYAKLEKVSVKLNQNVGKGQTIGSIGRKGDIFGSLHYKIFKDGKNASSFSHLGKSDAWTPQYNGFNTTMFGSVDRDGLRSQHDLAEGHFLFRRMNRAGFAKIAFDRKKVVLIKTSGETVVRNSTELNNEQKDALLKLKAPPIIITTRPTVPENIVTKWDDPKYYKVFIDGEQVENSAMNQYSTADFGHHSFVAINKKSRNPSAFELYLYTHDYHKEQKQKKREAQNEWKRETQAILSHLSQ